MLKVKSGEDEKRSGNIKNEGKSVKVREDKELTVVASLS